MGQTRTRDERRRGAQTTRPKGGGRRSNTGSRRPKAPRKNAKRANKRGRRSWFSRLLRFGLILSLVLAVVGGAGVAMALQYYSRDLPDVYALRDFQEPQVTRIVDREGRLLGESYRERRTVVSMDRVPRILVLSLLAAEDADFYRHEGLDYPGLLRAVARGLMGGGHRFRGTSTITQQLVKNLLLSPERTLARKVRELLLARRLEQAFEKDEILELYLNHVNFGHGRYGVQEASQYYFGKNVEDLTLAEASLIAGIPQSPTHLSPRRHPEAARRRQLFVLTQLERKRLAYWPDLSSREIAEARDTPVNIRPIPTSELLAPEVLAHARRVLRAQVGREAATRGGYTIHTSIDRDLQAQARNALQEGLRAIDERQHLRAPLNAGRRRRPIAEIDTLRVGGTYDARIVGSNDDTGTIRLDVGGHRAVAQVSELSRFNPDGLPASEFGAEGARVRVSVQSLAPEPETSAEDEVAPEAEGAARVQLEMGPQGAAVVIDTRSREVLALIGGYEAVFGFDRALSALRQPGSTFKPFVYAAALRSRRFTPATLVIDAPGVYDDWRPSNYETWSFSGELRLRQALARSVNQVAVRVMEDATPPVVIELAQSMGITSELNPSLALALGASEVRPIELVNAYASFAAGGRWAPTRLITRIDGPDGQEVPLPEAEAPRQVMTQAEAFLISDMLRSVVRQGTARRARRLGRPVAGKTGTSNDARDAWFMGFSPDLAAGVWVGYDDTRPLGRRESGARSALPIWIDVMAAAMADRPEVNFSVPAGIVRARIDPQSGLLAYDGQEETLLEYFLEGTEPSEQAPVPGTLSASDLLMEEIGGPSEPATPGPTAP